MGSVTKLDFVFRSAMECYHGTAAPVVYAASTARINSSTPEPYPNRGERGAPLLHIPSIPFFSYSLHRCRRRARAFARS